MSHVEEILRSTPEVESTSRRTGLELGLAAVTEPNTGDIAVKLKDDRSRSVDDVISDVREKIRTAEPALDSEFIQVLQDMIGDLTGAPEPVVVKLFSQEPELLSTWAPQVAEALAGVKVGGKTPVVDIEDGIENRTSGPALVFAVGPQRAARADFTGEELGVVTTAIMDGEEASAPVVVGDRPYPLRVRFPAANRASLDTIRNTVIVSSSGNTATLGSLTDVVEYPGQTEIVREGLQREVEVTARLEDVDLGTGIAAVKKAVPI
jgi:Cu/Ag efflux pump CusA